MRQQRMSRAAMMIAALGAGSVTNEAHPTLRIRMDHTRMPVWNPESGVPRHTPKMSDRPERGWRVAIRQTKYRKLQARRRANGRAGR